MAIPTSLVLSGIGIPPYSARGLTQTVEPIGASIHLERDVNGGLIDLSSPQMRKYASKITCTDQQAPALAGVWVGARLTVDCVFEFAFLTTNPSAKERTEVPGSVREEGDFTFYRPRLDMTVVGLSSTTDEWGASIGWELSLEET